MSDSQHTPLPWDWESCDEMQNRIYATDPGPANDFTIGFVRDVDTPTRDHNTKLIVHCVNTYPQLVEALRLISHSTDLQEVRRWMEQHAPQHAGMNLNDTPRSVVAVLIADAALRLAEEGESHVL